jgi:Papain fold toxin 2
VSNLSDEELFQEVGKIVINFKLLTCLECATSVMQWLKANGIQGKIIRLRTKYKDEDYILSDRLINRGIQDSITINGKHYGIEVRGQVFDNLSTEGMSREDWLNDFHCMSEQFEVQEKEF